MTTPRVPEKIKYHGFNGGRNKKKVETTDIDVIHFSPGLLKVELENQEGINQIAASYNKKLKGKVVTLQEKEYKVVKVFSAGTAIKIRFEPMMPTNISQFPEIPTNDHEST